MTDAVLRDVAYDDPQTVELLAELQQDMIDRYGGPDETPVDPRQFAPPAGMFVIAELDGAPVACAGLRRRDAGVVELKRMYVRPAARRTGLARQLLHELEDRARSWGSTQLVLETGVEQPEAIALYESEGYGPVPAFGYYAAEESSRYYGKAL